MWWRQFFAELSSLYFIDTSSPIAQECLQFCFMRVLKEELEEFKNCCNGYLVAKSCGSTPPRDRPNSLYFFPVLYDTESFVKDIDIEELE